MSRPYELDEGEPSRWTRRRLLFLAAIVLSIVVAAVVARPAYRQFKAWRSRQLAAAASNLLAQHDLLNAQEKARAAWTLAPHEPAALRAMARVLTQATNSEALFFWARLIQAGAANETDRRSYVAEAIRNGSAIAAAQELNRLLADSPEQPEHLWLAAQLFTLVQDRAQTLHYAALAAAAAPTNQQYNLFLASLQFEDIDHTVRATARSNVWARAREKDALALEAQAFLTRASGTAGNEKLELIKLLRNHPAHGTKEDLLALGLEIATTPGRRAALLDEAMEQYQGKPPEQRIQFAVWLNQQGEHERTLRALPIEEAKLRKDFFVPHLDALASLKRWSELNALLDSPQAPLEAAYREAFRARCDLALNNAAQADIH